MDSRRIEALRILGLPSDGDQEAALHAYRRLARAIHPDVSADPSASDRFAALAAAYRLVSETAADPPATRAGANPPREPSSPQVHPADGEDLIWAGPAVPGRPGSGRGHRTPPIVAGPVVIRPSRGSRPEEADRG